MRAGCIQARSWWRTTSTSARRTGLSCFMRHNDGTLWHTTEHRTHAEYQSVIKDLVLEVGLPPGTQT